jgi:hypothetical protein
MFIEAARLNSIAAEVTLELRCVGQPEAEARLGDDLPAAARDRIAGPAFVVDGDADGENIAWRVHGAEGLGARGADPQNQEKK